MKTLNRKPISREAVPVILRRLRREAGMTQTQLAQKLNVTRTCISNWESGERLPDCRAVVKMSGIFQVPVDYIYGMSDHKYNVKIPDYFELDMTKLNSEGMRMLHEYYKYLVNSEKYSAK